MLISLTNILVFILPAYVKCISRRGTISCFCFDMGSLFATYLCVLSQVFCYLGELNDSLSYALGAGPLFDVSEDSDYVRTILGRMLLLDSVF